MTSNRHTNTSDTMLACRKLGTGECDCNILCEGERYKMLSDQKDKNETKMIEVITYVSGGGLAFCANAASEDGIYIFPGVAFALTIAAAVMSFRECLDCIFKEMENIGGDSESHKYTWDKVMLVLFFCSLALTALSAVILKYCAC